MSLNTILAHLFFHLLETIPQMTKKEKKKKPQLSNSIPVKRQNKLWKNIMQDSSSRVRNLKHPAMCTASSRVPGGVRWMPISLLFCHAVSPVSRQSCHRSSLYVKTDTSCYGTWVNNTQLYDWRWDTFALLPLQTTWIQQNYALYRHLHHLGMKSDSKDISQDISTEITTMICFIYPHCELISVS